MRVDWAIACRYVEVNGALATIVGAGIDTFLPQTLPADLQVVIAARVVGLPDDVADPAGHQIVARVLDPQLTEVARLETSFMTEPNPTAIPGWEAGAIIPTIHTFRADQEGAYTIDFAVDGRSHTVPVIVRLAPDSD